MNIDTILLKNIHPTPFLFQEKFFLDVSPLDVLHDETAFKKMKTSLEELCGPSDRPSLECCVQSFTGHSGICYQMFDTVLAD